MTHDTAYRRLVAYHDRESAPEERAAIEQHLKECPTCSVVLNELQQLSQTIRQLPLPSLEPTLLAKLHASADTVTRRPLERFVGLLSGVAACLAMIGGLMLLRPGTAPAAVGSPPSRWEARAVGMIDETLAASPGISRETALGEWIFTSLLEGPEQ